MSLADRPVCLLLGSNIEPERYLPQAVQALAGSFAIERISAAVQTPSFGADGPPYLNAALVLRCALTPEELKTGVLRPLEARLGRVRSADKYAPRTIDLDVIVWDGQVVDEHLWERVHVAAPVLAVWPDGLLSPQGERLAAVVERLSRSQPWQVYPALDLTWPIPARR